MTYDVTRDPAYLAAQAYTADCTVALHQGGRRRSQWISYSDGVIELEWPPERKADIWFNELRFTDPETRAVKLIVRIPAVRIRREDTHLRRVVIEDYFGEEVHRLMLEYAVRLANESLERTKVRFP